MKKFLLKLSEDPFKMLLVITILFFSLFGIFYFYVIPLFPRTYYKMNVNGYECIGNYYNIETTHNKRHSTTRTDVYCNDGRTFINVTNLEVLEEIKE